MTTITKNGQKGQKGQTEGAAYDDLFAQDGGVGFDEGLDAGAYAIPFLGLLQGLSPAVTRGTPEYIEGAAPGLIINSVTKEISEHVIVSVVRRTHTICRWTPRDAGGGFIGESEADVQSLRELESITPDDKGRRIKDGVEYTEHRNFYVQIIKPDTAAEPALISMTKSQLKHARQWNTLIGLKSARAANGMPVSISEQWKLGASLQKNKKGDQWYGWSISHHTRHTDALIYNQVREGVTFAKAQVNLVRQLEQIAEPEEASSEL